jgi:PhnB protein
MALINVYLTFNGNCEEAFNFYKSIFGGEFTYVGRYGDMPPQPGKDFPASEANKIMHVSLPISKETILMGSDTNSEYGKVTFGDNFSISLSVDSKAEADKFFKSLSSGGKTNLPLADQFWGSYFGMLTDKYGINWMVSYDQNQQQQQSDQKKATSAV